MSKKILNIAAFGLAGAILGGKKKKPEPTPTPEPEPNVMPLPDDEKIMQARRKSIASQRRRSGRSSTILTGETLGGG